MTDLMDRVEKILLENGMEFEYLWDETCDNGWHYLQCNVREKED